MMKKTDYRNQIEATSKRNILLWVSASALALGLLFAWIFFPQKNWLLTLLGLLWVANAGFLIKENRKALSTRTAAFSFHTVITTLLVLGLLGLVNFMTARYPQRLDVTQGRVHTLSDQTKSILTDLQEPVRATFFSQTADRDDYRALLENYESRTPYFRVEYVDPSREITRVREAGIQGTNVLLLERGARSAKVDDITEEQITNNLIKLLRETTPTLCATTGHGEKDIESREGDGFAFIKEGLENQAYEVRKINLLQEGKIDEACQAIAILGPEREFFEAEINLIRNFLTQGGRAIISLDANMQGENMSDRLVALLEEWHVSPQNAFAVDPLARMFNMEAVVAVVPTFNDRHPVARDRPPQVLMPFLRPLKISEGTPRHLNVQWLAQTTPGSWGETSYEELRSGRLERNENDIPGPLTAAIAIDGKLADTPESRETRIIITGSSVFAGNNFARYGGNYDFFLNSISWLLEDESMISIRGKSQDRGVIEMTQATAVMIFWVTVVLIPLGTLVGGLVIWIRRRRL
jgi:ABC-type uncharacterized transport system involved in gliding motility auxiliary subunit